jgi:hypothetical protein
MKLKYNSKGKIEENVFMVSAWTMFSLIKPQMLIIIKENDVD